MRFVSTILLFAAICSIAAAQQPNKKELARLQKDRDSAKAAYDKHPKNPQLAQKFVTLNDKLAYSTMFANGESPHQRYSTALKLYRLSLKAAPKDAEAKKWVDEIEMIYKSMHRPIPK